MVSYHGPDHIARAGDYDIRSLVETVKCNEQCIHSLVVLFVSKRVSKVTFEQSYPQGILRLA